ncbi:MAG: ferrous iron transport protein B [Thermoproteota archaeon]|nr:MAG: ferrous iron transport protein B [Candidatus Korarchaeota archaeon]
MPVVALAANPNVGKSTLFNALTGESAHVANWPGVTVAVNQGRVTHHGLEIVVVDLPGAYSISAGSAQAAEAVTGQFILEHSPDALVVLVDATAMERTMYMVVEALELTGRVVVAVNMMDVAERRAIHLDLDGLSSALGVPFVGISALKGWGLGVLLDRVVDVLEGRAGRRGPIRIDYGPLEPYILEISRILSRIGGLGRYPLRWLAVKVLQRDEGVLSLIGEADPTALSEVRRVISRAERDLRAPPEELVIESRYRFIERVLAGKIRTTRLVSVRLSSKLDEVALHPIVGPVFSLLLLLLSFTAVFAVNAGSPVDLILSSLGFEEAAVIISEYNLAGLVGSAFDYLTSIVSSALESAGLPAWLSSLTSEGVIGGLGLVFSFLPLVFTVFFLLGVLQDSGLMARVAISADGLFRRLGVSGRAVFPAVLGFGCSVPAVLATRAMDSDEERVTTALAVPLIPCQARMVVALALASSFSDSPSVQAAFLLALYGIQVLLYLVSIRVMRRMVVGPFPPPPMVMELPPYHVPSARVAWWYARTNAIHFLKKAGTILFAVNVGFWLLTHLGPGGYVEDPSGSVGALLGSALTPLTGLVGLGDWRVALTLVAGFMAREAVLTTLASISGAVDPTAAVSVLGLSPAQVASLAVLSMAYTPCAATISVMLQEVRLLGAVGKQVVYQLVLSFLMAAAAYWILSAFAG